MAQQQRRNNYRTPGNEFSNRPFMALARGNVPVTESQKFHSHYPQLPRLSQIEVDGVDHINMSMFSKTDLGYALAMETSYRFEHPVFGPFFSVRGFSHWLKSGNFDDTYRRLSERNVANYYRDNRDNQRAYVDNFFYMLAVASYEKIKTYPAMVEDLKNSTLPFEMYRESRLDHRHPEYGSVRERDVHANWYIPLMNIVRAALKDGIEPDLSYLLKDPAKLITFETEWREETAARLAAIEASRKTRVKDRPFNLPKHLVGRAIEDDGPTIDQTAFEEQPPANYGAEPDPEGAPVLEDDVRQFLDDVAEPVTEAVQSTETEIVAVAVDVV